jgi:putative salt-induced outer membrane protein YdiY
LLGGRPFVYIFPPELRRVRFAVRSRTAERSSFRLEDCSMRWPVSLRWLWLTSLVWTLFSGALAAQQFDELSLLPPIEDEITPAQLDAPAVTEASAPPAEDVLPPPEGAADEAAAAEEAALQDPWFYPSMLCAGEYWESSLEFGVNGTTGNAQTASFRAGGDVKHKTNCNTLAMNIVVARTQADGVETQNNAIGTIRDDWDFCGSRWSVFAKETTEYDEFKAYNVRITTNAGLGYYLIKTDPAKFKVRMGSGFSTEIGGPNDEVIPEAVYGADYLPEWGDWDNFRIDSKLSYSIQLNDTGNLSLKLSLIDRYDSTPEGRKPNDLDYALLLMWKL